MCICMYACMHMCVGLCVRLACVHVCMIACNDRGACMYVCNSCVRVSMYARKYMHVRMCASYMIVSYACMYVRVCL